MNTKLKYLKHLYDSLWDGNYIEFFKKPIGTDTNSKNIYYKISTNNLFNDSTETIIKQNVYLNPAINVVDNLYTNPIAPSNSIPFNKEQSPPFDPEFKITINTNNSGVSASDQFTLYTTTGTTNAIIDWGDGGDTETWTVNTNKTHTYSVAGIYTIKITGVFRLYYNGTSDKLKILSLDNWGDIVWETLANAFTGCTNLAYNATDTPDLSACSSLAGLFSGCTGITTGNFNNWNLGAVTTASAFMFNCINQNCTFDNWTLPSCTNLSYFFYANAKFNNSINTWTTPSVTNLDSFLYGCSIFNQPMNNFYVGNVTIFSATFQYCTVFNQPLDNWDTAKATTFYYLFAYCSAFNQNINSWSTGLVTTMFACFYRNLSYNQPLDNWDVSKVTTFRSCFERCVLFNQDISEWNVTKVITFDYMFFEAALFNSNISTWVINTSAPVTMIGMFEKGGYVASMAFNQPIGSWNVTQVTNASTMFNLNLSFDQNLGSWNVVNIVNLTNFMNGKTPSTFTATNLDAIYNGWSVLTLQPNLVTTFGTAKYTAAGSAGRAIIVGAPNNWTLTDGGI